MSPCHSLTISYWQQEGDADGISKKLAQLKKNEKERQKRIQELQNRIKQWQDELDNPPEMEDLAALEIELVLFFLHGIRDRVEH